MPGMLTPEDVLFGPSDMNGRGVEACSQLVEDGREMLEAGCVDQGCMNWFPCHWLKGWLDSGEEPCAPSDPLLPTDGNAAGTGLSMPAASKMVFTTLDGVTSLDVLN